MNSTKEPLVCEDVQPENIRRLACAVVTQAFRDYFTQTDFMTQLDAALWLRSNQARRFLEVVDLDNVNILQLLTGPKPAAFRPRRRQLA